jgi:cystathionine beta-lyase/cystathionine gamma-synthase
MKQETVRSARPYIVRPRTALLTKGFDPATSIGSARPAVFRSSTFVFRSPEDAEHAFAVALGKKPASEDGHGAPIYARLAHPNANILEDQILSLEPGAQGAAVFNSGMAAITTLLLTVCEPGSQFVYTTPLYGGTFHFIQNILTPLGIHGIAVRAGDTDALTSAIRDADNLRLIFIETPANPTLTMTDIQAAAEAAHERDPEALVVVDNTLMGPVFQHPLLLDADAVVYSATKYISGFSDLLAGVVLGRSAEFIEQLRANRAILGNILQADECWLLDGRLPTVTFRMNRQSKNAQHIVEAMIGHPRIQKIHYPTLFENTEQRRIRDAQCRFPGALFSLELTGGKIGAFNFLRNLQLIRIAVSLGGVESLACHPATTTHSEMSVEDLEHLVIFDNLVRVSIGVEDWRDLLRDILQAL